MSSSVQIKQEFNNLDERNQNVAGEPVNIDCSVFNNQNLEYTYYQLPYFWDQALQAQGNQPPKNFHDKHEISQQVVSKVINVSTFIHKNLSIKFKFKNLKLCLNITKNNILLIYNLSN